MTKESHLSRRGFVLSVTTASGAAALALGASQTALAENAPPPAE